LALSGLVFLASGIGCSLVYSYGTVEQATQMPDGSTGDDVTTTDAPSGVDHASADGPVGPLEASTDSGDGGSVAVGDADAGPPLPPVGAVVISGVGTGADGGPDYVLSVLDPTNGHELSRESMPAVGVAYDGVTDIWYIFETLNPGTPFTLGPYPPAPGDPVVLHVRTLDTHTGKWTELTTLNVPPMPSADMIAPLKNRLAYVGYNTLDAGAGELIVLDTSTPSMTSASPTDTAVSATPLSFAPGGMFGTRPSTTGSQGGSVALLQNTSTGAAGDFQFITARVGASSVSLVAPVVLGPSAAQYQTAGGGSFLSGGPANVFALPNLGDAGGGTITEYDPTTGASLLASPIAFAADSDRLQPVAISECSQMAFVAELTGSKLFAVPLSAGGTPTLRDVTHTVSNVRFEPFTNTVVTTFNAFTGWEIGALSLGGTATAPTLSPRTAIQMNKPWAPPGDLRPTNIAVRQPIPYDCGP
jgi:hypothetical protein